MTNALKYGIVFPVDSPEQVVEFAAQAEAAGWDGYFVADVMWGMDSWSCLAAAAMRTERIRLGTLLTPLSVMRPWKIASQVATLDRLSKGRAILTVGMGAPDVGFAQYGEVVDLKTRAELVDESLDIIEKLWGSEPFRYKGKHYQIDVNKGVFNVPKAVQEPHVPVWVVAAWPRAKSMRRALRCNGLTPYFIPREGKSRAVTPEELGEIKAWIEARRENAGSYDYVIEGQTPANDDEAARAVLRPWAEAGATWFIESLWDAKKKDMMARLKRGPVRLA